MYLRLQTIQSFGFGAANEWWPAGAAKARRALGHRGRWPTESVLKPWIDHVDHLFQDFGPA
jgi:hypothetical protein